MELNPEKVTEIFIDCLLEESPEDISTVKIVDGITIKVGFKPEKLQEHEETINDVSFRAVGDTSRGYAIGDYNHSSALGMEFHTVWGDGRRTCGGDPDQDVYYAKFTAADIMGIDVPATGHWMQLILVLGIIGMFFVSVRLH